MEVTTMKSGDIKRMFNPKTIALIGATDKEGSIGSTVMQNLLRSKERKVFAINPKRKTVMGIE